MTTPPPAPAPLTLEQIRMAQARQQGCKGCVYFCPAVHDPSMGYCVRYAPQQHQTFPLVDAKGVYCGEFHPNP